MNAPHGTPRLVVGCGYLGSRVAREWLTEGTVYAVTRTRAAELAAEGFTPVVGDVRDPATLWGIPPVAATLFAAAGRPMRELYVGGLANLLDTLPDPGRVVFVSSTGVYGQDDGSEVDEDSPTEPAEESGRVMLEAERLLLSRRPDSVVLRFAGIYGPGRLLREASLRAGEPVPGDPDRWLNLIHVADGADVVCTASRSVPAGVFNVADDEPCRRRDFFTLVAETVGAPPATFDPGAPAARGDRTNRRVRNARMKAAFGVGLRYPSFRSGVPASFRCDGM